MRVLIVYYSFEGNTKEAAQRIASELSADILELMPVKDILKSGFWKFMLGGMKAAFGMGTKLQPIDIDLEAYSYIILGTPIWAGKTAPAINQFLKMCPVSNRILGVFTCSGGGDNNRCVKQLKKQLPGIKYSVALADRNNTEKVKENSQQLDEFICNMKNLMS